MKLFASSVLALLLMPARPEGQAPALTITPENPTILAGQAQQFTASGTLTPTAFTTGGYHTCLLSSDRTVRCVGRNNQGQLGNGTFNHASDPIAVSGLADVISVRGGMEHTCALIAGGTMKCWGTNYTGQLGDGTIGGFSLVPGPVHGITDAIAAVTGGFHTCAVLADQTVRCWGRNQDGQLGNGDRTTDVTMPGPVTGLGPVATLSAGAYHTCAIMPDSSVRCWGRNDRGQLGDGTVNTSTVPVPVSGLTGAVAISPGGSHSGALVGDGRVQCWGQNDFGQIGSETLAFSSVPITVTGISSAVAVAAGFRHTCAVQSDGAVRCWGLNDFGELGNGTTTNSGSPVPVTGITGPGAIAAGEGHSCAFMPDISLRCWGRNDFGELGNGTTISASTPVKMNGTGVAWTSSISAVATIDATGKATGIGRGTTTITATDASGNAASTMLTVRTLETLSVALSGGGSGSVGSSPAGITCGSDCSEAYLDGTSVTLTATAAPGSILTGWTGCNTVSGVTCTVVMTSARSVTASFARVYTLTVSKSGLGNGTITSSPGGINCGGTCSASYVSGTSVTLTATPAFGSVFLSWSGCDSTSDAACTVGMSAARSVTATFIGVPVH